MRGAVSDGRPYRDPEAGSLAKSPVLNKRHRSRRTGSALGNYRRPSMIKVPKMPFSPPIMPLPRFLVAEPGTQMMSSS